MGEIIEFKSNGSSAQGYLASPREESNLAVVVIQEWWGMVPHIKDVCERFAQEGFFALAPDLYNGKTTTEPDEAAKEMMALQIENAAKQMSGAADEVAKRANSKKVGVVGFCMGGGLALYLACLRPDLIKACVPFYGVIPWPNVQPDWSKLEAKVLGHYAELDEFSNPQAVKELESKLKGLGKDVKLNIYPGVHHAFFNDTRPEVYDEKAAKASWESTVSFLKDALSS